MGSDPSDGAARGAASGTNEDDALANEARESFTCWLEGLDEARPHQAD